MNLGLFTTLFLRYSPHVSKPLARDGLLLSSHCASLQTLALGETAGRHMFLIVSGALKGIDGLKAASKWSMRRLFCLCFSGMSVWWTMINRTNGNSNKCTRTNDSAAVSHVTDVALYRSDHTRVPNTDHILQIFGRKSLHNNATLKVICISAITIRQRTARPWWAGTGRKGRSWSQLVFKQFKPFLGQVCAE